MEIPFAAQAIHSLRYGGKRKRNRRIIFTTFMNSLLDEWKYHSLRRQYMNSVQEERGSGNEELSKERVTCLLFSFFFIQYPLTFPKYLPVHPLYRLFSFFSYKLEVILRFISLGYDSEQKNNQTNLTKRDIVARSEYLPRNPTHPPMMRSHTVLSFAVVHGTPLPSLLRYEIHIYRKRLAPYAPAASASFPTHPPNLTGGSYLGLNNLTFVCQIPVEFFSIYILF